MTTDPIETLDADPLGLSPQVSRELRPCASYTLRVNGFERPVTDAWIGESLLYVLRERLGLAGAKDGCEQGECGACSVQVDGQLVAGCLVPAALAADSEINTVEGLSAAGGASDVQQALAASGAVQCGYCTPGMAMAVHDLLQRNHRPTEVEARQALCGNLCRCTGYKGVLAAVQTVADARALEAEEAEEAAAPAEAAPGPEAVDRSAEAVAGAAGAAVEPEPVVEPPVHTDAWIEHVPQQPVAQRHIPQQHVPQEHVEPQHVEPQPQPGDAHAGMPHPGVPQSGMPQSGMPQAVVPHPVEQAHVPAGAPYGDGSGGYDTGVYDTAGPAPVHGGIPAQAGDDQVYYPPQGYPEQPYQGTPAHGTYLPYPDGHQQQNGYDTGYDAPVYEPTPAHGTPLPGAAFDGTAFDGTPPHGTPYVAQHPHGVPAEGGAPAGVQYGATPAHGIRLPEDDHAS
ncbi:2Fe-2S iron-sulfur cluster-binding protein [Kitasatospora xanthocidica]|uniref:2Fe-2S iron-sulfur cluster-binding protein n=1 Tax=Kitasatospora xanthocidica TaxID=83382 RepID=UPI0036DFC212